MSSPLLERSSRFLLSLAFLILASSGWAGTLIEVTGAVTGGKTVTANQAGAVAFVLTQTFTKARISVGTDSAPLLCVNCQGSLFVTKALGLQATVADIVATKVLAPGTTNQFIDNLTLPPGTYFFVIAITQGTLGWSGTLNATISNHASATDSIDLFASATGASALTASYAATSGIGALHYTLTGEPVPFAITQIKSVANNGTIIGHEVTFNSVPDATYILEFSDTLGGWLTDTQQLPAFPSQGTTTTTFVGILPIPKEFYRIRKL